MYCVMNLTFMCDGDADEASPKLAAAKRDIAALLHAKHPAIDVPGIDDAISPDDIDEVPSREEDFAAE